jgi:hypothetical protein
MKTALVAALLALTVAVPAAAQPASGLSLRPFALFSDQRFTADQTFDAVFGRPTQIFWGGGLNITEDDQFYLELTASRFKKTGQRAFLNNGQVFGLGIPLTATITPFEITAGYRFHHTPARRPGRPVRPPGPTRFIPYLGGGVGLYRYKETSEFAVDGDDLDVQHAGIIAEGGLEVRLHRWFGIAGDVHYTYVPGILGNGGISKEAGESDLGGIAVRVKVIVGR